MVEASIYLVGVAKFYTGLATDHLPGGLYPNPRTLYEDVKIRSDSSRLLKFIKIY